MAARPQHEMNVLFFCTDQDSTLEQQIFIKEHLKNVTVYHTSEFIFLEKILEKRNIDIIFADIDEHVHDILEFVSKFKNFHGELILQSNSPSFAPIAFDLEAVDYLFKPYSFDRFKEALNKALNSLDKVKKIPREKNKLKKPTKKTTSIVVKERYKSVVVRTDDIVYLYSKKGLIHIVTTSKTYYHYDSLNNFEKILDRNFFTRTNRNCICNLKYITSISDMGNNKFSVLLNRNNAANHGIVVKRGIKYRLIDKLNKNKLPFDYLAHDPLIESTPLLLNRA